VQSNPGVLADQFENLWPGCQAMRAGQGPEQVEVNLGLLMFVERCLWGFGVPAEGQKKQNKKENGFAHENLRNDIVLLFHHTLSFLTKLPSSGLTSLKASADQEWRNRSKNGVDRSPEPGNDIATDCAQ